MQLVVTVRMSTPPFFDPEGGRDSLEPARILRDLADTIEAVGITGGESGLLRDMNRRVVGTWRIAPLRDEE